MVRRGWLNLCWVLLLLLPLILSSQTARADKPTASSPVEVQLPAVLLSDTSATITLKLAEGIDPLTLGAQINGELVPVTVTDGVASLQFHPDKTGMHVLQLQSGETLIASQVMNVYAGWLSLVPAILAIFIALAFRQVIPAIFIGVWAGSWIVMGGGSAAIWDSLLSVVEQYVVRALVPEDGSSDHMSIVVFTLLTGGMIGVISQNGGMRGIVELFTSWANTAKRGQLATSLLGTGIFFDDYANTIIIGNTMQPLTDKLKISREKLAYLVDSTSAPLACIAIVTTWIGFQVSLINEALGEIPAFNDSAYSIMLNAIPYSFYPLLALFFVYTVVLTGRDFGPMLKAERRARSGEVQTGTLVKPHAAPEPAHLTHIPEKGQAWLALLPISVLVGATMAGLYVTGEGESLGDIIGSANSFKAMLWASFLSLLVAIIISVGTRTLTLGKAIDAMQEGLTPMLLAAIILTFAWAISDVNGELHTAEYIVGQLGDGMSPEWLPASVFVIAALTAFATGASWGTMGILMPLVIPLTWAVLSHHGLQDDVTSHHILYAAVAAVLSGAVWGDHCSPISDTTILSSLSSGCDHIAHVQTQLPYAVLVGLVSMVGALLPVAYGLPWWAGLMLSAAALVVILYLIGRDADVPEKVDVNL